jgi:hypothetical protein
MIWQKLSRIGLIISGTYVLYALFFKKVFHISPVTLIYLAIGILLFVTAEIVIFGKRMLSKLND